MDCLLLHCFNLEGVELLIKDLAEVHHHRLVDLLPQVGAKDLNERNLQRRNFTMHEDSSQI